VNGAADVQAAITDELKAVLTNGSGRPLATARSTSRDRQPPVIRDRRELYDGALEDIINSMREEPYMAFDGVAARKQRQKRTVAPASVERERTPVDPHHQQPQRPQQPPPAAPKPKSHQVTNL